MEGMLLHLRELGKDVRVRPTAFSNMYGLRFLRFFDSLCDFGFARSNKMYLPSEGIETLPESIWKMRCLKQLRLHDCPYLEMLQEISDDCMSSSLEKLDIYSCPSLKSISASIWKKNNLKHLTIEYCPDLEKLHEVSDDYMSSSLEVLEIRDCAILKSIPESIWKIRCLKDLTLKDCPNLENLQEISDDCMSSENLPMNLRTLYLSGCEKLKSIPVLPSRLNYLDASNCASLDASICLSLGTMSSWWDLQQVDDDFERCQAVYPGNEIPFRHQTDGNAFSILFPANWFLIHDPLCRFLISIVFTVNGSLPHIDFNIDLYDADRLHYRVWKSYALETDGNMIAYRCETDHVFIGKAILNLKDVFGEEWTSVCSNIIDVSFRVSIEGDRVIPCIKKVGLKMWGTASKNKRGYSECSDQTIGNQDESHDPHINSKRIKAQSNN
ncbi:hypothetical protein FEM48_Zijuj11G0143800 [Ziziphus jujuba var. spinosa]|uniref:Disease resistance-like protein DSC1 n=1 Tax=Ziziphus jujuba var. spinosa TaxID=714518 RepID=A0A978UJG3_ZIZJJ|nr:hypothetical protein FEM48_Zijuj11G0143800 [Ziziphus jujuba var. spinosa]